MNTPRTLSKPTRHLPLRLALEQRIVFDGALATTTGDMALHAQEHVEPLAYQPAAATATHATSEPVSADAVAQARADKPSDSRSVPAPPPKQIAFVDASVQDITAYLPNFAGEVVVLRADQDGLSQIAQVLGSRSDVAAIHIVGHGQAGVLLLGNGSLDTQSISGLHAADLAVVKAALTAQGDVLLYGCDVAAGAQGQAFIDALAKATDADVAASTDATGAAALGGNWRLEADVGSIEARSLDAGGWNGLLSTVPTGTWTVSGNTASVTTAGITATVSYGSFSNATTSVTGLTTTGVGATLNNIAAFSNGVQNTASLGAIFNWHSPAGVATAEAAPTAGTGVMTITFSEAVVNPIIHLDRLGGAAGTLANGMRFTLVNRGGALGLTRIAGTSHFAVDSVNNTIQNSQIDLANGIAFTSESSMTPSLGTAAGSVQVNGTVTSVQFLMSAAPNSNEGAGSDGFEMKLTLDPSPKAVNDSFSTPHNSPITINVRANDTEATNDALTVSQVNGTAVVAGGASVAVTGGTVALNAAGDLLFSPDTGFVGPTSFTYDIVDAKGQTASATVSGAITEVGPVVDLNSASQPSESISNGSFSGSATGWTVAGAGGALGNAYVWSTDAGAGTLTQSGLINLNNGYGPTGAATVNMGLGWRNSPVDTAVPATLDISVGGVLYARFITNRDAANGSSGGLTYFNGASGPATTVLSSSAAAWSYGDVSINLPANVAASGSLVFAYAAGVGGGDDISIDNVSVLTRTDAVAGNNFSTAYVAGALPVSIAATTAEVRDNDDSQQVFVSIVLTNPQPGDLLSVIGPMPVNTEISLYDPATGTIILSGPISLAGYAEMIRGIGFSSTNENTPTVTRVVNVQVNDGLSFSAVSSTTITVSAAIAVNSPPMANADSFETLQDTAVTINVLANDTDPNGDALTVTQINGAPIAAGGPGVVVGAGVLTLTSSGSLVFTPTLGYLGTPTFQYTVADPSGAESTAVVSGTVWAVNSPPVAGNDYFETRQNTPVAIDVLANDSDPNGDALTITQINGAPITAGGAGVVVTGGVVAMTAVGDLIFTADANYLGTFTFDYTIADPAGAAATATVTVLVKGPNLAPVAFDDTFATQLDTPVDVNVRANDTDGNGDWLTITQINGTPISVGSPGVAIRGGVLTLNKAQVLTFTPDIGYLGTPTFQYTIADPSGATSTATVNGSVTGPNGSPVAHDDVFTTTENTPVTIHVTANDSDANGDMLTVTEIDGKAITAGASGVAVTGGVVSLTAAGDLLFTPDANYIGTPSFAYTVADPSGLTSSANVSGTVTVLSHAPVASDDGFRTPRGRSVLIDVLANDTDPDGNTLTVTQVNGQAITVGGPAVTVDGGVVSLDASGQLLFRPTIPYNGNIIDLTSFDYTVADPSGLTATATVNGTVFGLNSPIVAQADVFTTTQGTPVSINVTANDSDANGGVLTVTEIDGKAITAGAAGVAVTGGVVSLTAAGDLLFAPDAKYIGTPSFVYTVADAAGFTSSASVSGTVTAVNRAPVARADTFSTLEDTAVTIPVRANDSDPAGGALTITEINGAAITAGGPGVVVPGGVVSLTPAGDLVFVPDANYNGTPSFTYTVADAAGLTSTAAVSGTVTPVNDAPSAGNDSFITVENVPVVIHVGSNDSDVDNDLLAVTAINGTAISSAGPGVWVTGGVVTLNATGDLLFTPDAYFHGAASFSYRVTDSSGASATANVNGVVVAVNHAPTARSDSFVGVEGSPAVIQVLGNDSDVDGDTLTVTLVNGQRIAAGGPGVTMAEGVVTLNAAGDLIFTPLTNFSGAVSFSYTVADPTGAARTALVSGAIAAVNHVPVAQADVFSVQQDQPLTMDLRSNDVDADGDALVVSAIDGVAIKAGGPAVQVANGRVSLDAAGRVTFTPTLGYAGPVAFNYAVVDPLGATATASVSGTVMAAPGPTPAPVMLPPAAPDGGVLAHAPPRLELPRAASTAASDVHLAASSSAPFIAAGTVAANFGAALSIDSASLAEINASRTDDLSTAAALTSRDNQPIRQRMGHGSDAVFVMHAVRHQAIVTEPALYVQTAVRLSQVEAQTRNVHIATHHHVAAGDTGLFDPFAVATPAATLATKAAEAERVTSNTGTATAEGPRPAATAAIQPHPSGAAPGFAAQLQQSALEFRARLPRTHAPPRAPSGLAVPAAKTVPSVAVTR